VTAGQRVVVAGNGMAGFRFVQELLAAAGGSGGSGFGITVASDEPGGAYNRAQLPLVLSGAAHQASIELADPGWFTRRGVRLVTAAAARIDRSRRVLVLADGTTLPYDVLVLATGSVPVLPSAEGLTGPDGQLRPGVVAFRTLADCGQLQARSAAARRAVVLGGGVLGLETARALAVPGLPVTLLQRGSRLMERQLDAGAARILARTARALGVTIRTWASVTRVRGSGHLTGVTGVVLDDGTAIDADLLVLCCGTRPRTELARSAGLAIGDGVIVDDQLRSVTDPAVFAIGDCAEHRGRVHGLVASAWAQARAAAQVVSGQAAGPAAVPESPAIVRLKAAGIELAVLGSARGGGRAEVIRFTDPARGVYTKLVVRDGRLAGAILVGDTRNAGTLSQLLDRGAVLPADRSALLAGGRGGPAIADSPAMLPDHATVCHCNGVTKGAIRAAWQDGASDPAQIAARTRAATGCGTCRGTVDAVLAGLAAA
jgi:assimilatory nitrate reductase electron transfer subunit